MRSLIVLAILMVAVPAADRRDTPRGKSGQFDYFVMALSWSPGYCASPAGQRDRAQCAGPRQFNFVLHGLWPQYERGWPQFCQTSETLPGAVVQKMLDIMPSPRLVEHEWAKHGVCAGVSAAVYFSSARRAFEAIKIPAPMQSPKNARRIAPAKIRDEFAASNPGTPKEAIVVACGGGRFLSEVRLCLTRDFKTRACSADTSRQACRADEIIVEPIR